MFNQPFYEAIKPWLIVFCLYRKNKIHKVLGMISFCKESVPPKSVAGDYQETAKSRGVAQNLWGDFTEITMPIIERRQWKFHERRLFLAKKKNYARWFS